MAEEGGRAAACRIEMEIEERSILAEEGGRAAACRIEMEIERKKENEKNRKKRD